MGATHRREYIGTCKDRPQLCGYLLQQLVGSNLMTSRVSISQLGSAFNCSRLILFSDPHLYIDLD